MGEENLIPNAAVMGAKCITVPNLSLSAHVYPITSKENEIKHFDKREIDGKFIFNDLFIY